MRKIKKAISTLVALALILSGISPFEAKAATKENLCVGT